MKFYICLFHNTLLYDSVKEGNPDLVQYLLSHAEIDVNLKSIVYF